MKSDQSGNGRSSGSSEAELHDRYDRAVHAMQSAVALEIARLGENAAGADAKHLRAGVNNAMADQDALAKLLIDRGLITSGHYLAAIVEGAEREAREVAERVRRKLNLPDTVTFG